MSFSKPETKTASQITYVDVNLKADLLTGKESSLGTLTLRDGDGNFVANVSSDDFLTEQHKGDLRAMLQSYLPQWEAALL